MPRHLDGAPCATLALPRDIKVAPSKCAALCMPRHIKGRPPVMMKGQTLKAVLSCAVP